MNTRAMRAIIRKDLLVVRQSKPVILPIIIVPTIMLIIFPILAGFMPALINLPGMNTGDFTQLLALMPPAMQDTFAPYTPDQQAILFMIVYMFAPLYLIVPMMVASVIAADSFAGEKERKTLEALIYTPTTDQELYTAKLLSAWLPAVTIALLGFIIYSITANIAAWPTMQHIFFPNLMWLVLAIWVAPAVAGLGLAATVLVSARVKSFQEAFQLGGIIVLPLVALVISQATGVLYLSTPFVLLLGLILWVLDAALLLYGIKTFRRGEIIAQL